MARTHVLYAIGLLLFMPDSQVVAYAEQSGQPTSVQKRTVVVNTGAAYARSEVVQVVTDHVPRAVGGWVGVGTSKLRLQADYWYKHTQRRFTGNIGGTHYETSSNAVSHGLDLAVVRYYRFGQRVRPHWLAGAGYLLSRGTACGQEANAAADCNEWDDGRVAGIAGAGLDVSLSAALFFRVQTRWYMFSGVGLPVPVFAVGVGVGGD